MCAKLLAFFQIKIGELAIQFIIQLAILYGDVLGNVWSVAGTLIVKLLQKIASLKVVTSE